MARNRDTGEQESFTFTSTSFVLSVLFLAGVLATGIILVATGPHRDSAAAAAPAAVSATSNAAPPVPLTATPATGNATPVGPPAAPTGPQVVPAPLRPSSSCGLPAGGQQIPTAAPAGSWQIVAGIAVPISPVFGPARLVGGIGTCYARSPTGALFAMMDTLALTEAPSDQISATAVVTRRGSRTGQYAQALTAAKTQDSGGSGVGSRMPSDASTTPKVTLLGFRFVDYTPDRATIAVAVGVGDPARSGSYQPAMLTAVLAWEGGDWKFVYSDQTGATAAPIISTEQYTAWAA